jgi:hypothetical protein
VGLIIFRSEIYGKLRMGHERRDGRVGQQGMEFGPGITETCVMNMKY